jgi:PAS domain S-box-containing protein
MPMNEQVVQLISYLLQGVGWIAPIFVMALLLFRVNIRYGVGIGSARVLSGGVIILMTLLFNAFWQYHFGKPHGFFSNVSNAVMFIGNALSLTGASHLMENLVIRKNSLTIRHENKKLKLFILLISGSSVCGTILFGLWRVSPLEVIVDTTLYNLNIAMLACMYFGMGLLVLSHLRTKMHGMAPFFLAAGGIVLFDGIVRTAQAAFLNASDIYNGVRLFVHILMAGVGCTTLVLGAVGANRMAPLLLSRAVTDSIVHYKLNVQKRFLLLLVIAIFVIGATGFVIFDVIQSGKRTIENTFFNEQRKVAESVSANMEGLNQSFLTTLKDLSDNPSVEDVRTDSMRIIFKNTFLVWKNIAYSISRTDEHGILRYTYPEVSGIVGTDISHQTHIQRLLATHDTIFTGIFMSLQGYRSFAMYVPVYARDRHGRGRHFAGGVALLLNIDAYALRAFRNTNIFTPNPLAAVNSYGRVIVASDNRHAGVRTKEYLHGLFPTLTNDDSLLAVAHRVGRLATPQFIKIVDNTSDFAPQWLVAHPLRFTNKPWGVIILPVSNNQVYSVYGATIDRQMILWGAFAIVLIGLMGAVVVIFYRWSRFLEEEVKREFTIVREAEGKYAKLFNEAVVGIFQTAPDGSLISANPSMAGMLGYATTTDFILSDALRTPAVNGHTSTPWEEILAHQGSSSTVALRKTDGSFIHALVHCKAIMAPDQRIQQYEGFVEDVTSRKRMEDALRSSEIRFRAIFEGGKDAVFVADLDTGIIIDANKEAEKLIRRPRAEIIGLHQSQLHPPELNEEVRQMFGSGITSNTNGAYLTEAITSDGTRVPIEISATIIDLGDGKKVLQGIFRDVADRIRLEQQLLQAQKLEGIGTLAGGIAHDFNNLLAMILGSAELLRLHSAEYPNLKKYVDRIIEASERGASISRQLLIFSRPDQAELKQISLSGIITELEELLKHFLPKSVTIETQIHADSDIIMGDAGHLHQALLNLALNANDAMPDGGSLIIKEYSAPYAMVKKKIPQCERCQYVAVSFADTGVGIDDTVKAKIFDPFFSTKERGKGTGLGLSIVHGIVKSHQGYINVESIPLKGTIFTLYFPVHAENTPASVPADPSVEKRNNETILIVDDEELIREMLKEFLEEQGFTVITAANGQEALKIYQHQTAAIDIVITDLGMPEMGGEELYACLRRVNPSAKVMVSSGYLDKSTKDKLLSMGIKDVLTKPYRFENIQAAIDAIRD